MCSEKNMNVTKHSLLDADAKLFASMKGRHQSAGEENFFKNMRYKEEGESALKAAKKATKAANRRAAYGYLLFRARNEERISRALNSVGDIPDPAGLGNENPGIKQMPDIPRSGVERHLG